MDIEVFFGTDYHVQINAMESGGAACFEKSGFMI